MRSTRDYTAEVNQSLSQLYLRVSTPRVRYIRVCVYFCLLSIRCFNVVQPETRFHFQSTNQIAKKAKNLELRKCCLGQSAKSKIPYHLINCFIYLLLTCIFAYLNSNIWKKINDPLLHVHVNKKLWDGIRNNYDANKYGPKILYIADLHWGGFTTQWGDKKVSMGRMKSIQWNGCKNV
jgi:hypothetical protein